MACEECDEQRARRRALEDELRALEDTWGHLKLVVRYIERPTIPPAKVRYVVLDKIVERFVDRPVDKIVTCWSSRSAGPFGRIGDRIDRLFNGWP